MEMALGLQGIILPGHLQLWEAGVLIGLLCDHLKPHPLVKADGTGVLGIHRQGELGITAFASSISVRPAPFPWWAGSTNSAPIKKPSMTLKNPRISPSSTYRVVSAKGRY